MSDDSRYIAALLTNDSVVITEIYDKFFPYIQRYVLSNSGDVDDAYDVMQEAIIAICKYARREKENGRAIILTTSFRNFFIAIAVKAHLKALASPKNKHEYAFSKNSLSDMVRFDDSDEYTNVEQLLAIEPSIEMLLIEQDTIDEQREELWSNFSRLGEACQSLIDLRLFKGLKPAKIAEMKQTTPNYISKHYNICLKRLREIVAENKEK